MPMTVSLKLETRMLGEWAKIVKRESPETYNRLLDEIGGFIADTMREKAPVRTGFLRRSISVKKGSNFVAVGPTAAYALFVEYGTKPHIIEAVHAMALAFQLGGRTVFAKRVFHPGFPGKFFVKSTGEECMPKVWRMVLEAYMRLLKRGEA